jgi:uncharacterized membrane protein YfcA
VVGFDEPWKEALSLGVPATLLAYAMIVVFAASVVKGLTGFGFSLLAVPFFVVLFEPRTAVPIIITLNAVSNIPLFIHSRRWSDLGRIWPLIAAGVVSIPAGTYLLMVLDPATVRMVVGIAICLFAAAFLLGFRRRIRRERRGLVGAGILSGALNGLISAGGPPVILFLPNQGMARDALRANLIAFFLCQNIATFSADVAGGLVSGQVLRLAAVLMLPLAAGAVVGIRLVRYVPETAFRKAVLVIVLGAGVMVVLASAGVV